MHLLLLYVYYYDHCFYQLIRDLVSGWSEEEAPFLALSSFAAAFTATPTNGASTHGARLSSAAPSTVVDGATSREETSADISADTGIGGGVDVADSRASASVSEQAGWSAGELHELNLGAVLSHCAAFKEEESSGGKAAVPGAVRFAIFVFFNDWILRLYF